MLAAIISQYLESNRRLVIPNFGALLVKEPGHRVLFSQLLTRDDGVLHSLIVESGASELEANGMIDRLLFDIRYALEAKESYLIEGVGRFVTEPSGAILFIEVKAKVNKIKEEQEQIEELQPSESEESEESEEPQEAMVIAQEQEQEQEQKQEQAQEQEQIAKAATEKKPKRAAQQPRTQTPLNLSLFEADPDLEGLSYGSQRRSSRPTKSKGGLDIWMVIAIAVATIALAAILYGFLRAGAGSSLSDHYSEQQF